MSANTTRFTSTIDCLDSLRQAENAFMALLAKDLDIIKHKTEARFVIIIIIIISSGHAPCVPPRSKQLSASRLGLQVVKTLQDRSFWLKISGLCSLMKPFSEAVMAIQGNRSTLADVTRYFLYLAHALKSELGKGYVPAGELQFSPDCAL